MSEFVSDPRSRGTDVVQTSCQESGPTGTDGLNKPVSQEAARNDREADEGGDSGSKGDSTGAESGGGGSGDGGEAQCNSGFGAACRGDSAEAAEVVREKSLQYELYAVLVRSAAQWHARLLGRFSRIASSFGREPLAWFAVPFPCLVPCPADAWAVLVYFGLKHQRQERRQQTDGPCSQAREAQSLTGKSQISCSLCDWGWSYMLSTHKHIRNGSLSAHATDEDCLSVLPSN
eukprot:4506491-Pleurochrysis_carterae.AAC.11